MSEERPRTVYDVSPIPKSPAARDAHGVSIAGAAIYHPAAF
jgi:hypothetical protein